MGADELLKVLRAAGFTLRASGVSLIVKPGKLTDDDAASIAELKQDLLAILRAEVGDDRVTCATCRHHSPKAHRCQNFRAALLLGPDIAVSLSVQPQRCPGFDDRPPATGTPEPISAGQEAPARPENGPGRGFAGQEPTHGPSGTGKTAYSGLHAETVSPGFGPASPGEDRPGGGKPNRTSAIGPTYRETVGRGARHA